MERLAYDTQVLEEKYMISIILYLLHHDGCKKCELYGAVARNSRMATKLDSLESAGLLTQVPASRSVTLHLTEKGSRVAETLDYLDRMMGDI